MDMWIGLLAFAVLMGVTLYVAFSAMYEPLDEYESKKEDSENE